MNHFVSIQLDKKSKTPLYKQLGDALYNFIQKGVLKPNTKLPTIRTLASQLKINNVTVVNAYKYLENKGVVYAQIGSGTYVSPLPSEIISPPISRKIDTDIQLKQITITKNTINFASISPTTNLFPVEDFKEVFNQVLERDKGDAFSYQESQGYYGLRESIVDYLKNYGINTKSDNIQIISGAQQGIDILSKALLQFGDILFVEQPTYHGAIAVFQNRGARIVEIPLESDGINIPLLEDYLKIYNPKFIYMMSYYQNPTGYSYSLNKKRKLLDLAEKYNTYIIEDDYLSDLNYSKEPNIPLKALDHRNRVIYIKSFSKILMPGLRLGFLVAPKPLLNHILSAKHTTDISTSSFIQRVFDLYLRKELWKNHINKICNIYNKRYDCFIHNINKYLDNYVTYTKPNGGLSLWLKLIPSISTKTLCDKLLSKDVIISPGSLFSTSQNFSSFIRLSFAAVDEKEIEKGLKIIKDVIEKMIDNSPSSTTPFL
ncbi:MocR-like pyridoxine biosynthesis transcription factor PdxR [Defluviitalea phaphyphila]|uniref:MocR-like pyridoxine biosynthesis transcription factor PdxR n=1 Tax=Defluviitalea phaphyphila TaxID=1473580 RepID=UPI000730C99F|nr:PLP-dependent aminotransferase family protein [Defluviitalea phaphyphila]